MTLRIVGSATAAVLAAAALAASAGATLPTDESDDPTWTESQTPATVWTPSTQETFEYVVEASESDPNIECLASEESRPDLETETTTSVYAWDEGDACASGDFRPSCKRVAVSVKQRSLLFLAVAFEWVLEKTWCWSYPRITSWSVVTYPMAEFENCVPLRGCIGSWYPRVKIHVAAGGAWRYEKDV